MVEVEEASIRWKELGLVRTILDGVQELEASIRWRELELGEEQTILDDVLEQEASIRWKELDDVRERELSIEAGVEEASTHLKEHDLLLVVHRIREKVYRSYNLDVHDRDHGQTNEKHQPKRQQWQKQQSRRISAKERNIKVKFLLRES